MRRTGVRLSTIVAGAYTITGLAWVGLTDFIVAHITVDAGSSELLQSAKGAIFIAFSAVTLFALMRYYDARVETLQAADRENSNRLRLALSSTKEAVWDYDTVNGKMFWSPELRALLSFSDEMAAISIESFRERIHPLDRQVVLERMHDLVEGKADSLERPFRLRNGHDKYVWVLGRGKAIRNGHGKPNRVIGTLSDVTERHERDIELDSTNSALAALSGLDRAILTARKLSDLFPAACRSLVEGTGYGMVWISRTGAVNGSSPLASYGIAKSQLVDAIAELTDTNFAGSPVESAQHKGETTVWRASMDDTGTDPWSRHAKRLGFASAICVPIKRDAVRAPGGETIFGSINIYSRAPEAFRPTEIHVLEMMGQDLGHAIDAFDNARGWDAATLALERANARLEQTLLRVVESLSAAMETRDPYTVGHEARVAELSCAIGAQLGLADVTIRGLRTAALLHDIGKIGVPPDILSRPGKLSGAEFELVKKHCEIGDSIVKSIDFPWPVRDVIMQHHERMDGSGYPRGLTAHQICLEARIIGVADIIEAMVSHRPYRPARPFGEAVATIKAEAAAGKLDQQIVDACIAVFEQKKFSFAHAA